MKDSVSVIIPAYNEEDNIQKTLKLVIRLTSRCIDDFEIVVINDGSTDRTGEIVRKLAQKDNRIKLFTHNTNQGLGTTYLDGIRNSTKTYVTGYPADNDQNSDILTDLIQARKKADMVLGYMTNFNEREFNRKVISLAFIKLMNFLFRLNLKYYNGYFICRCDLLKKIHLKSTGFTLFAEAKIRLIKKGIQFIEIPYETKRRKHGVSKALNWRNVYRAFCNICVLFWDVHIKNDL